MGELCSLTFLFTDVPSDIFHGLAVFARPSCLGKGQLTFYPFLIPLSVFSLKESHTLHPRLCLSRVSVGSWRPEREVTFSPPLGPHLHPGDGRLPKV